MLRELRIQNFKGWKDTGSVKLAPITLLFGTNSSGKSSIGQFLMMLKQTVESSDRKSVLFPGGAKSAVKLGSYPEMVHGRDVSRKIQFAYSWELPEDLEIRDPVSRKNYRADAVRFAARIACEAEKPVVSVEEMQYSLSHGGEKGLKIRMKESAEKPSEFSVDSDGYTLKREKGRPWSPRAPIRFYGFPDVVVAYYQNSDFVQDLNLAHENLFNRMAYLGPLREEADRLYSWQGDEPESVGFAGEKTVAALLAASDRELNLGPNARYKPVQGIVSQKLKDMGLIADFKVEQIAKGRQEYEVKVKTRSGGDFVDLPDVGFGLSQVLPVLVECFYAPANSIIIVEQPEIHLHPSAQAALADVMIDVVRSRENRAPRNIQLIIESHSEHFLRRLQRRIAEEKIDRNAVAAYFARSSGGSSKLDPLQIDDFGNILNWPEHFFGDEMADITGQARAALMRKRAQQASEKP